MKRICIIDSIGEEDLHGKYKEVLSHVDFNGYTPPTLQGVPLHGHGGWCAWDILSQSLETVSVDMLRIFDENGSGGYDAWPYIFRWMQDNGPYDYVNNSWGSSVAFDQGWLSLFLERCGDATIGFAASNSGRGTHAYPQMQLINNPQVIIVGAIDAKGVRPAWSSTGEEDKPYAKVSYLGIGASLDAITGEVVFWQGTSKACPNALGDLMARDLNYADADTYYRDTVLRDDNENGLPDGIHEDYEALIMSGGQHPDVGIGVCEIGRQENMRETGLELSVVSSVAGIKVAPRPMYHDFKRIG